ncbi:hypothetical protein ACMV5I_29500, partial [Serratia sp. T13T92]
AGLDTRIGTLGGSVAGSLGGGTVYDSSTGTLTAPSYTIQGNNYSNVGDAFGGVNSSLTSLSNSVASGITGVVQRTATKDVVTLTEDGGTAATPGNAQKLTNLAAGMLSAASTEAVNGSQLFATNSNVTTNATNIAGLDTRIGTLGGSVAGSLGGGTVYDSSTGTLTAPSYTIQGNNYSNVGDAFGGVNMGLATNATNIADNITAITNLANGTLGLVKQDATTQAITVAADTAGSSVSVSGTDGSRTLTGVTSGMLSAASTEAVNGSQLFATNSNVTTNATNIAGLDTRIGTLGGSVAGSLGGGTVYDSSTGTLTAPSYTIQGNNYSNVGDAFGG